MAFNNFTYDHDGIEFLVFYKKNSDGGAYISQIMLGAIEVTTEINGYALDCMNDRLNDIFLNDDL
tara:strand:- start:1156 stop:1350 length:195 start_codon:yes stop_codon:yes gene_type:complete